MWAVLTNKGSANQANMDQFGNFWTISCTKCKLKEGLCMPKNASSCIWGPTMPAVLHKWGYLPNWLKIEKFGNFSSIFCTTPELKRCLFYEKISKSIIWGPTMRAGLFWKNGGVCQLTDQIFLVVCILNTKKLSPFYAKSCYWPELA